MNTLIEFTGDQLSGSLLQGEMIPAIVSSLVETSTGVESLWNPVVSGLSQGTFSFGRQDGNIFYILVAIWILIIVWVIKDSTYRSTNTGFVIFSLLLVTVATPLIGLPLYLAIRPLGYKYERAYRKAIMTQEYDDNDVQEEDDIQFVVKDVPVQDADEAHIAHLQLQAKRSKTRSQRGRNTMQTKQETSSSTPVPRKPKPRT